jgi:FkbM family methyltransferase
VKNLNWYFYRVKQKLKKKVGIDFKKSYSQSGEDLIVRYIFDVLKMSTPRYLDLGAHHPTFLNNTQIFYENGSTGVNVEPDPDLFSHINKVRLSDTNLNIGIADKEGVLDFYVMSATTLNTFSHNEAKNAESDKVKINKIIQVPVLPINNILNEHFIEKPLDFLSMDVEGLDLLILQTFDFKRFRPKVICVETVTFSQERKGEKITGIENLLVEQGYFVYADTNINTIFVDRSIW